MSEQPADMTDDEYRMSEIGVRDAYFEWRTGHAPGVQFREYLHTYYYNIDPSDVDWGWVCRQLGIERDVLDKRA